MGVVHCLNVIFPLLVVLAFVPVVVLYSAVFYRLIARRFVDADEAEGELSTVVQENATGVRVVRAFGREKFEMDRFREKNDIFAKLWIRLGTLSGLYWGRGRSDHGLPGGRGDRPWNHRGGTRNDFRRRVHRLCIL